MKKGHRLMTFFVLSPYVRLLSVNFQAVGDRDNFR